MDRKVEEALQVLGVAPLGDPGALASAYRRSARATHPDVSPDPRAAERFARVSSAYAVVCAAARSGALRPDDIVPATDSPQPSASATRWPTGTGVTVHVRPAHLRSADPGEVGEVRWGLSAFAPPRPRPPLVAGPPLVQAPGRPRGRSGHGG